MKKCYIYCFTNLINNKQYIGSTIMKPNIRYNQHIYSAMHENSHSYNYPLYQAIRKYGLKNFKYEILFEEYCEENQIRELEKKYILLFNTLSPNGYNQTLNTEHPINDILTYKKISEIKREKAKRVAELDVNQNILTIWRSIIDCAEDTGLNEKHIASCCRGERKSTGNRYFLWIDDNENLLIPEYKRDNYKGKKGTTQIQSSSKAVLKLDDEGNILNKYPTLALAARENNCDSSAISKVCRGLRKKCGGYQWKYE